MQKFKINDRNWRISFFDPDTYTETSEVPLGLTKYMEQMIIINETLQDDVLYSTIKHEITHAFRWSFGFVVDTQDTSYSATEVEEITANLIECFGDQIIDLSKNLYKKLSEEKYGK